ncbi:MAG: 1-deoxy-D-xylulose-5-phosphate synthase [Thermotogaceae bacterium]|nr:1-deoxy-D-xylulose-5-phosphate synthase [Thermotogaceae bacterium]
MIHNELYKEIKRMTISELKELAKEIRKYIIEVTFKNSGHLASNLGTVELTLALYKVFDFEKDHLIWDTSHQAYTHKIITKRAESFRTLRTFGGISGYTSIFESPFDRFGAGHAGTSIAAALGIEMGLRKLNDNSNVVAVVGDGALTSGMVWESLNQLSQLNSRMKIILNNNGMSINKSVGALSKFLTNIRMRKNYIHLKEDISHLLEDLKLEGLGNFLVRLRDGTKHLILGSNVFEDLEIKYFGPIDGHDLEEMIDVFENVKAINNHPLIVDVITVKGKGFEEAEKNPTVYHGVEIKGVSDDTEELTTYSKTFGKCLEDLAKEDDKIVAVVAAMAEGTGLGPFFKKYPDRAFDLGITEPSCVTFAGGLATKGFKPVVAIYSTFLQRAFDQIVHDIALQNLNVVFAIDRAGIVGKDGPTHHGMFDISYLRLIPNVKILSPASPKELEMCLKKIFETKIEGPIAIRYPREETSYRFGFEQNYEEFNPFKWQKVFEAPESKVAILAVGSMVERAVKAARKLLEKGVKITVYNCRAVKPLDFETLRYIIDEFDKIVTVEENVLNGGFGESVNRELMNHNKEILNIGIGDRFVTHGEREELLELIGLSADKIYEKVDEFCNQVFLDN